MSDLLLKALALLREGTLAMTLPILGLCAVMWVLIAERVQYLVGSPLLWMWPPWRRRRAEDDAALGRAFDAYLERPSFERRAELVDACSRVPTPYAGFILNAVGHGELGRYSFSDLILGRIGQRVEAAIESRLGIISSLSKTAPLLGLLGTVVGMIQTFRAMMSASTGDPRALSYGISIALIATEIGLVVALSGVVCSSWLNRRAAKLEEEIRLAALRLEGAAGAAKETPS